MGISAAGSIKITIEQKSTGDGARAAKQTTEAIKGTTDQAKKAAGAGREFDASMKGLKGRFGDLNAGREAFENIRSNVLFLPTAIAGVAVGISELIQKFSEATSAAGRMTAKAADWKKAEDSIDRILGDLNDFIREGQDESPLARAFGADAGEAISEAQDKISTLSDELRRLQFIAEQTEIFPDPQKNLIAQIAGFSGIDEVLGRIGKLTHERLDTEKRITDLYALQADALAKISTGVTNSINAAIGALTAASNVIDLDKFGGPTVIKRPPRSAGVRRETTGLRELFDPVVGRAAERIRREESRSAIRLEHGEDPMSMADVSIGAADTAGKQDEYSKSVDQANAIKLLNEQLSMFRDTIASLSGELGPFGGALSELGQIWVQFGEDWAKWGEAGKATEKAIVGSLGAIAKAGAAQIKNEQLRAGVLSIIEFGLGWASYAMYDYGAAAAHWTASAILAGTAIFGGGGGGKSAGGTAGSRANVPRIGGGNEPGSGSVTIINNGTWFGINGPQETAADLGMMLGRHGGNGYSQPQQGG